MKRESRAPLIIGIGIVLLLLPVLYVGSYLAIVVPGGRWVEDRTDVSGIREQKYRFGDKIAEAVFWPLEQIDRKMRPDAWESSIPIVALATKSP
jgi:hypothetical protein